MSGSEPIKGRVGVGLHGILEENNSAGNRNNGLSEQWHAT